MTKDWEDIKDEVCRLYTSGKTLPEVQKAIEERFDFKASARTYRSQFKRWGITRASQLKELQGHNTDISRRDVAPPADDILEDGYGTSGSERSCSIPPDSRMIDSRPELQHHKSGGTHPSIYRNNSAGSPAMTSMLPLETMYDTIRRATERECRRILGSIEFTDGQDNIIHYAAFVGDTWTLSCILYHLKSRPSVIDLQTREHRTALELAIEADRGAAVETLLSAGASLQRRNKANQQPLHFAISLPASSSICNVLIRGGADIHTPFFVGNGTITPTNMVLQRFVETEKDYERDNLCRILQMLIDSGAQIDSEDVSCEASLIGFVKASTELDIKSLSVRRNQIRPSSLLGYYLNADRNPLCWFDSQYCPADECRSYAAFIFAHTPNSGLSKMLIESCDLSRFGLDLIRVLLSPCRMRYSSADDPSINDLLTMLLQRMQDAKISGFLEHGLVSHLLRQMSGKKSPKRLETLLRSGYVSPNECREALLQLEKLDIPIRFALAELLISQIEKSGLERPWEFQVVAGHFFPPSSSKLHDLADDTHTQETFKHHLLQQLKISGASLESSNYIVQCVIHFFTKRMLEGKMGHNSNSVERIIYIASRLRKAYHLPDIPVAKELLLRLRYVNSQSKKSSSSLQRSDASDWSDSPETVTSEAPSVATPENNIDMDYARTG